ncbi:MAG: hypothetical protein MK099_03060, partial [Dehalococcoidia bacterium]|nr:hypothetical protein [Dehalococcoidia bacterium]
MVVMAMVFMALSVPLSAIFLRRQPEDMGLTVDGVQPLPPNSNRSPGGDQLGEEAAWTVKQAFRTATMCKLLAFALAGVAQGASVHRIPYWIEKGFDAQTVSFSF